jgi:CheY-like chemotaxis protein
MKKNILLVDDENVFHFINSKVISSTGIDCEIQTASNGQEALAIINKYLRPLHLRQITSLST